jgi:ABC-type branched-subunit amino acid transport system substrate-binding protein
VLNRRLGCVVGLVMLSFIGQTFFAVGGGASQSTPKLVANDSVDGIGAVRLNARIDAAKAHPLKARGTPIVLGQRVTVAGDYPFQDSVDAVTAMANYYNNVLGGVGANYQKGIPGRPIKIVACTSDVTAASAQNCSNQLIALHPLAILDTLNLTQTLEYAAYAQAGIPVIEATGLFPSAMSTATVPVVDGGCLTSGVVPMVYALGTKKYKRVAFITSQNLITSQLCLNEYQDVPNQFPNSQFKFFRYNTTAPDQLATAEQVVGWHPDAIIEQTSGPNCSQFWSAWKQLGYKGQIFDSAACNSSTLFASGKSTVVGNIFNFNLDNEQAPTSYFANNPLAVLEFRMLNTAFKDYKPSETFTSLAQFNATVFMWLAGVLDQLAIHKSPITASSLLSKVRSGQFHQPLRVPGPNCTIHVSGLTSLCNYTNDLWKLTSVSSNGTGTWKLIATAVNTQPEFMKLGEGSSGSTTTSGG